MSGSKSAKRWKQQEPAKDGRLGLSFLSLLVLLSGFASLIYQVLWMRQLGLLFGSGAQAAAATLAMFFAGMGVGSWWWGRRVRKQPLSLYALLECGIAVSALAYLLVLWAMKALYPSIYAWAFQTPLLMLVKLLMAALLICPAAFFMGGTIPAMAQVAVQERDRFGRVSAWLYGINTFGATLGVVIGAFVLLPAVGVNASYGIAVGCSLLVAGWAWRGARVARESGQAGDADDAEVSGRLDPGIAMLAFVSGFVVLGLEVAWTRIFAQVHENSVYSFAMILAVVLLGLAIGSWISSLLSRLDKPPTRILLIVLLVSGGLIVLGPVMILAATKDLQPVHTNESWGDYLRGLFRMGIGGVGFTVVALGVVFPFLMKMAEREVRVPGRMLGRLLAINTMGAILGSLVCGFVLLPMLGMWSAIKWLAIVHLLAASVLTLKWGRHLALRLNLLALIWVCFTVFGVAKLPVLGQFPGAGEPEILEIWEDTDCTVVAVEKPSGHRAILINASYSLGSTAAYAEQANQSIIPLNLFPETRSVFYIGIGTGMSVGAALDAERYPRIEEVVACELSPAVVKAASKWIPEEMTRGVFDPSRCTVLVEDGRHHLMASPKRYDMINADLFLPYRRGAGSLYSIDHYEVVAERLNPGGVFVQWLPMYQITEFEFGVIAHTMLQVFDELTMWRNNFVPGQEKVALIARQQGGALSLPGLGDPEELRSAVRGLDWRSFAPEMVQAEVESMPFLYAGNLGRARQFFEKYPTNSDNHPVIEFQTPWRFREVAQRHEVIWCVGPRLTAWMDRLFEVTPPAQDPVLAGNTPHAAHLAEAGLSLHHAMVAKALGNWDVTDQRWAEFKEEWIRAATPPAE